MLFSPASPSSVLALVTTVHLGTAALRNHRTPSISPVSSLALVSFTMTMLPWVFPSPLGLTFGVFLHLIWFATCEYLAPPVAAAPSRTVHQSVTQANRGQSATMRRAEAVRPRTSAATPKGFLQVPVLTTIDETPTIKTIRIVRPDGFDFTAGQFMPVRIRVDGRELTRCYSISSAPAVQGYLEISVKRQGVVSNALHATARPGSLLTIRQAAGSFTFPAGDDRPIVLIAGGIGVTPLMSMLRHAVMTEPGRPISLLYGVHTECDFAFRDEIECLARRHPQFRLRLAAATGTTTSRVYPGRIDASLLKAIVPDLAHSISFVCGPTPMIESMKALLANEGVPASQIRHEVFEAAVAAAAEAPPRKAQPTRVASYRMSCTRSQKEVDVRSGRTVLEAAEDAGVDVPSLCRAGVCGTCRVRVAAGEVECESAALAADEVDAGFVLACVATPQSDFAVEL